MALLVDAVDLFGGDTDCEDDDSLRDDDEVVVPNPAELQKSLQRVAQIKPAEAGAGAARSGVDDPSKMTRTHWPPASPTAPVGLTTGPERACKFGQACRFNLKGECTFAAWHQAQRHNGGAAAAALGEEAKDNHHHDQKQSIAAADLPYMVSSDILVKSSDMIQDIPCGDTHLRRLSQQLHAKAKEQRGEDDGGDDETKQPHMPQPQEKDAGRSSSAGPRKSMPTTGVSKAILAWAQSVRDRPDRRMRVTSCAGRQSSCTCREMDMALHDAVYSEKYQHALALAMVGADVNFKRPDDSSKTPLHIAAAARDKTSRQRVESGPMIEMLVAKGADPETEDQWGATPLILAVRNGFSGNVESLLDCGANPNHAAQTFPGSPTKWTPLRWANEIAQDTRREGEKALAMPWIIRRLRERGAWE